MKRQFNSDKITDAKRVARGDYVARYDGACIDDD